MHQSATWQLIYTSDALLPVDGFLLDIVRTAEVANARHGLSGLLCYSQTRFVQLVEGDRAPVVRLLQNLQRDLRHRVGWTAFRRVGVRQFSPSLPMGYAGMAQLTEREALGVLKIPSAALAPATLPAIAETLTDIASRLYPSHMRTLEVV